MKRTIQNQMIEMGKTRKNQPEKKDTDFFNSRLKQVYEKASKIKHLE